MNDLAVAPRYGNEIISLSAQIASAYVGNNPVNAGDLPRLLVDIHSALSSLGRTVAQVEPAQQQKPAVPVKRSVNPDFIICLEDGKPFKSLKRHLRVHYNLSPEQYREKWKLPADYPMVAPNYAEARSVLAKRIGLGQKSAKKAPEPARKVGRPAKR